MPENKLITLKLKNEAKILQAFRNSPKDFADELQKAMQGVSVYTLGQVKSIITSGISMWKPPIDTGAMRRGIQVKEVKPLRAIIIPSATTPYAKFVHDGTRRMKARPFFDITVKEKQKDVQKFFQKALDNVVNKIARSI